MKKLKFSTGNAKINRLAKSLNLKNTEVVGFDIPAGYTCPAADICKTFASVKNGKQIKGKNQIFNCYAANIETAFKNSRLAHWHNFNLIKNLNKDEIKKLIAESLPKTVKIIRIHSSGDYFKESYFNAWLEFAIENPNITLFGYTKILKYVITKKPANFKLVYSHGGIYDKEAQALGVPTCKVVEYSDESICKDKELDADEDYNLIMNQKSFTLNLHGVQAKNRKKLT